MRTRSSNRKRLTPTHANERWLRYRRLCRRPPIIDTGTDTGSDDSDFDTNSLYTDNSYPNDPDVDDTGIDDDLDDLDDPADLDYLTDLDDLGKQCDSDVVDTNVDIAEDDDDDDPDLDSTDTATEVNSYGDFLHTSCIDRYFSKPTAYHQLIQACDDIKAHFSLQVRINEDRTLLTCCISFHPLTSQAECFPLTSYLGGKFTKFLVIAGTSSSNLIFSTQQISRAYQATLGYEATHDILPKEGEVAQFQIADLQPENTAYQIKVELYAVSKNVRKHLATKVSTMIISPAAQSSSSVGNSAGVHARCLRSSA